MTHDQLSNFRSAKGAPASAASNSRGGNSTAKNRALRSLQAGFEPARGNPIGFQVQLLNHSDIAANAACFQRDLNPFEDVRQENQVIWLKRVGKTSDKSTF